MIALSLAVAFQTVSHEFVYVADRARSSVSVAGTFNGWNQGANPMQSDTDRKTWRAKVDLKPGRIEYKFVLDGTEWITDPKAVKNQDDGNGNVNSVLMLLPADYARPAVRGDGTLARSALEHRTNAPSFNFDKGKLTLTLRTRAGDIESVKVKAAGSPYLMERQSGDDLYETYRVRVPWSGKGDLEYVFLINEGGVQTYGQGGLGDTHGFKIVAKNFKPFVTPNWVDGRVFYQIFPERFANGDKTNDPSGTLPWGSEPKYFNYMGGDLAGILQKADYLEKLGVGGIYLNPIFEGPSNHGYETSDYLKVAGRFGTNDLFASLVKNYQSRGMRVVLDGVFNHTATDFAAFADIRKNEEKSKYSGWYWVKSYPVKVQDPPNYTAWFNFPSMPKVNLSNPDARKYFLSIPGFWKKTANIDGWRLDVANEVDPGYWMDFRKAVKAADPNGWIVGEVWGDGSAWLAGDQWDSIMGYQFRDAALRFVAEGKITPTEFLDRLMRTYDSYAPQVSRNLMSLLSSHDTPRFLTLCGGDHELAKLGAALQMTWPGSPSIYYGEEIGMKGGADPDNRRCMEWDQARTGNDMLAFYTKVITLRMQTQVLKTGEPVVLATNDQDQTLAFARVEGNQAAIVAANRSATNQTISIPLSRLPQKAQTATYRDELGTSSVQRGSGALIVTLAPKSSAVLLAKPGTSTRQARDAAAPRILFGNRITHPAGEIQ